MMTSCNLILLIWGNKIFHLPKLIDKIKYYLTFYIQLTFNCVFLWWQVCVTNFPHSPRTLETSNISVPSTQQPTLLTSHWLPSLPPNSLPSWHHNDYPPFSQTAYPPYTTMVTLRPSQPTFIMLNWKPTLPYNQPSWHHNGYPPSYNLPSWHHTCYLPSVAAYMIHNITWATLSPTQPTLLTQHWLLSVPDNLIPNGHIGYPLYLTTYFLTSHWITSLPHNLPS